MSHIIRLSHKSSHQSTLNKPCLFTDTGRLNERMENSGVRQSQELTSEQLGRAQALANIKLNYQRPDEGLIKKMREKNAALSNQAVKHSALSTLPTTSTLFFSQIDQFASNLSIPHLGPPNVSPFISGPSPSVQPLSDNQDWEDLAKKSIARKALSLDRVWDRKTWKQKASNIERLKLLKDDGYDIAPLQGGKGNKVTADAIITALLAHVKVRKVNKTDPMSAAGNSAVLSLPPAISEEVSEPAHKATCDGYPNPTVTHAEGERSDEESRITSAALFSGVVPRKVPESELVKVERRLWVTYPTVGIKRKHTHDDDYQPDWSEMSPHKALHDSYNEAKANGFIESQCTCCMYDKILRVMTQEEISKAFQEQAFDIFKRRIGREIFRYSRAARRIRRFQASTTSCRYVASSKLARIVLRPLASPAHLPSWLHVCISADVMDLIMKELKHIAYGCDEDSSMYIYDPEEAEDREDDSLIVAGETADEHFRHHIRLSTTSALQMVIEGEIMALVGLIRRLRESELTHCRRWQYDVDRMEVIAVDSVPWYLSDASQSALEDLVKLLEAGQALGDVDVHLEYLSSPEKVMSG